jgi:hypothetical protein
MKPETRSAEELYGPSAPAIKALEASLATAADPQARLQIWKAVQGMRVAAQTSQEHEDERPRRGMDGWAMRALEARNKNRAAIAKTTSTELDLEAKLAQQGGLTNEEVDALIKRKELESRIELTYGVNLTSELEGKSPLHWTADDLSEIEGTFARIPGNQLPRVGELALTHGTQHPQGANAVHDDEAGRIEIFDRMRKRGSVANGDHDSPLADNIGVRPRRGASGLGTRPAVSKMEETLAHEIGHDAADRNPAAYRAFQEAAGWQQLRGRDLTAKGVGKDAVAGIDKLAENPADNPQLVHDGQIIRRQSHGFWNDDKSPVYVSRTEGGIPESQDWQYARSSPGEHFAETYTKAINSPEFLHGDLVSGPQAELTQAEDEARKAQLALNGAYLVGSDNVPQLKAAAAAAQLIVEQKRRAATSRGAQWKVMREQVFGVNDKQVAQQAKALGLEGDQLTEFKKQGEMAMTPDQLQRLADRFKSS